MAADIYTTGEVARLLDVAPRTVAKWIDRGLLSGYRLPGSDHRRVTRADLEAFCRAHAMRLPWDDEPPPPAMAAAA